MMGSFVWYDIPPYLPLFIFPYRVKIKVPHPLYREDEYNHIISRCNVVYDKFIARQDPNAINISDFATVYWKNQCLRTELQHVGMNLLM